jgi:hypothetical protein
MGDTPALETYLNLRQILRPPFQVHHLQSDANGARGNDDHAVAILSELDCGLDDDT